MGINIIQAFSFLVFVFQELGWQSWGVIGWVEQRATHNNPIGADCFQILVKLQKSFTAAQSERYTA